MIESRAHRTHLRRAIRRACRAPPGAKRRRSSAGSARSTPGNRHTLEAEGRGDRPVRRQRQLEVAIAVGVHVRPHQRGDVDAARALTAAAATLDAEGFRPAGACSRSRKARSVGRVLEVPARPTSRPPSARTSCSRVSAVVMNGWRSTHLRSALWLRSFALASGRRAAAPSSAPAALRLHRHEADSARRRRLERREQSRGRPRDLGAHRGVEDHECHVVEPRAAHVVEHGGLVAMEGDAAEAHLAGLLQLLEGLENRRVIDLAHLACRVIVEDVDVVRSSDAAGSARSVRGREP